MAEQGWEAQSQQDGERSDAGPCARDSGLVARGPAGHIWGSLNKRVNNGGKDDDLWHGIKVSESVQISVTVWISE